MPLNNEPQENELRKLIKDSKADHPHNYEFNVLKHRWDYVKALLEGRTIPPFEVEIQLSSSCDLFCQWCVGAGIQGQRQAIGLGNFITEENVEALVDGIVQYEVESFKVDTIKLSGFIGEPLLRKKAAAKLIQKSLDAKRKVGLFTNGIHLDDPQIKNLVANIEYLHVSLDAGSPQSFSRLKLMGRNDTQSLALFDIILTNIKDIAHIREQRRTGLEITVGYVLHPGNYYEIVELARKLKDIGVNRMRFKKDITGLYNLRDYQRDAVYLDLIGRIHSELVDDNFEITLTHKREYDPKAERIAEKPFPRCLSHSLWGTIGSDGNVYPCDHTTFRGAPSYGSAINGDFGNIWEGEQRQAISNHLPMSDVCVECSPFASRINIFLNNILELVNTKGIERVEEWRNEII